MSQTHDVDIDRPRGRRSKGLDDRKLRSLRDSASLGTIEEPECSRALQGFSETLATPIVRYRSTDFVINIKHDTLADPYLMLIMVTIWPKDLGDIEFQIQIWN